jgi:mRNA-degrading endonuclease toxin of MazEF toxin-antitoxin module
LAKKPNNDEMIRGTLWTISRSAYHRLGIPIKERRPWLIVQNNNFKTYGSRLACPLTSVFRKDAAGKRTGETKEQRDTQVVVASGGELGYVSCDDIYTIKKGEFIKCCGTLHDAMPQVEVALKLALGIKT